MAEYEITSVIWHERNDQIYVTYADEEPDHMVSTQHVAADLARDAGLSPVAAPHGIHRWVRTPEGKAGPQDGSTLGSPAGPATALEARAVQSLWLTLPTTADM
jgi:hypothetical protein